MILRMRAGSDGGEGGGINAVASRVELISRSLVVTVNVPVSAYRG